MRAVAVLLLVVLAAGCATTGADGGDAVAGAAATASATASTSAPTPSPSPTPTAPPKPQVVEGRWCSDELVDYMVEQSTSSEFKRGFGRPALLEGLDVGCTAIAKEVSFAGYLDTFAFVRREKGIDDLLAKRIVALGYQRDDFAPGVFMNAAGNPEGFIRILGEGGDKSGAKFADHKRWVVIQFYLPG